MLLVLNNHHNDCNDHHNFSHEKTVESNSVDGAAK